MRQNSYDLAKQQEPHRTKDLEKTNRNNHLYSKITQTLCNYTTENEQYHRPATADQTHHVNISSSLKKAYFYRKNLNKSNLFHLSPETTVKYNQKSFEDKKSITKPPIFFEQTFSNKNKETLPYRLTVDFVNMSQFQRHRKGNHKNATFGQFIARKKSKQGRVRKLNEAWSVEQTKKANSHIDLQIQGRSRFVKIKENPPQTPSPIKSIKQEKISPKKKSIHQQTDPLPIEPHLTSLNNLQKIDIELYNKRMCNLKKEKTTITPATIDAVKTNELGLYIHSLRRSPDKPSPCSENRILNKNRTFYNQEKQFMMNTKLNTVKSNKQKNINLTDDLQGWNVNKDNEFIQEDIFNKF